MSKFDIVTILKDNSEMQNIEQENQFFKALELIEQMPQESFDNSLFSPLCTVFTDNTMRIDGIGSIATLLDARYLQSRSYEDFYALLNQNIDKFFPRASGWLASIIASGLFTPNHADIIIKTIEISNPTQAQEIYNKLMEILAGENLSEQVQAFVKSLGKKQK